MLTILEDSQWESLIKAIPTNKVSVATEAHNDSQFKTILSAFDEVAGKSFNVQATARRIIKYSIALASKDEHIAFFGGNLLGTDRIRMLPTDRDSWFDDILEIDEEYLRECVHSVPSINTDWVVTSDVFNLSIAWFIHKCFTSGKVNDKDVSKSIIEALVVLQFKFLSSIYSNYFDKPVDYDAAEATYAALTLKFKIKQLGSWGAMLRDRAESVVDVSSPHYQTFKTFTNNEDVMYIISDIQTRTRKTVKDQYKVLDKVRRGNLRVLTSNSKIELDGERILKDKVTSFNNASRYLIDVSGNESSFIKKELVDVITDVMSTVSKQAFTDLLISIANKPNGKERDKIEEWMNETLQHAFNYIANNRIKFNDVGFIVLKMRALYTSPKSNDPILLKLRREIEVYAKRHTHLRAPSALAAARTSLMLYFLVRALSSQIYS